MTQQEYKNEIKELKERIAKLEVAKIEELQLKRWKPKYGNRYYFITSDAIVGFNIWNSNDADKWRYLTDNCFETKEEAEEYKKQIKYTARYKNYIEEHSEPIDWNRDGENKQVKSQAKYYAVFKYNSRKFDVEYIDVEYTVNWKAQGIIYASSEQIIWNAIKEIGEDNFKKYVLGVK